MDDGSVYEGLHGDTQHSNLPIRCRCVMLTVCPLEGHVGRGGHEVRLVAQHVPLGVGVAHKADGVPARNSQSTQWQSRSRDKNLMISSSSSGTLQPDAILGYLCRLTYALPGRPSDPSSRAGPARVLPRWPGRSGRGCSSRRCSARWWGSGRGSWRRGPVAAGVRTIKIGELTFVIIMVIGGKEPTISLSLSLSLSLICFYETHLLEVDPPELQARIVQWLQHVAEQRIVVGHVGGVKRHRGACRESEVNRALIFR